MPIEILMPALSPTMTEGNLVKWHKREGDTVKAGDLIAEIETDKATMEVEAVDDGRIGKILVAEGTEQVQVNQPIAILLEEGEDDSALNKVKTEAAPEKKPEPIEVSPEKKPDLKVVPQAAPTDSRIFASPLARRIAGDANLNLGTISGSGPRGRIIKEDVERALAQGGSAAPAARPSAPSALLSGYEPAYDIMPTSNVRKIIAKRLIEAKQTIPHFYLTVECDIDALLKSREKMNARADGAYKLSVNDFIIKACGVALSHVPEANASWIEDQIYQYKSADVAVAVAIEGGLITPVIRQADAKGLAEISKEIKDLAARAREGKLKPQEFQGGTFSLSNLGMYGIKEFSAIINPPQGCILAVGMGEERPVVRKGLLTSATLMTCTLSVDHRVVDGAVGAKFLKVFKELIENPVMMIL
ncbi:MAG TPA: pyruvate dehydrogenase complex dihydrolipoamide acetyltransferase [Alphaproteobacteria bacterium]|nr:pyruvate dehydrogenase complex dihydrolipoamide acetyltransferase [Alphaproteobacteria bacterium]